MITGRLGKDMNLDQGKDAARQVGLAILATVKDMLGSLNKVKRLIKTFGMVNCTDDFLDQPKVINGFSELMKDVFGEDAGVGVGARSVTIPCPATSRSRSSAFLKWSKARRRAASVFSFSTGGRAIPKLRRAGEMPARPGLQTVDPRFIAYPSVP